MYTYIQYYYYMLGWCEENHKAPVLNATNTDISLHIHSEHIYEESEITPDNFCIDINFDKTTNEISYDADVCKEEISRMKFA